MEMVESFPLYYVHTGWCKCVVWCCVLHNQLIEPFIFPGTLTGAMYLHCLQNELPQLLQDVPLETQHRMYCQHDGAPAHFTLNVRDHLNQHFPQGWISRGGPHPWPARSPDLTPFDYCLWGWMKDIVYQIRVNTREELIVCIMDTVAIINKSPDKLRNVTRAILTHATKCVEVGGDTFENLL